jgi:hypothetical protein
MKVLLIHQLIAKVLIEKVLAGMCRIEKNMVAKA